MTQRRNWRSAFEAVLSSRRQLSGSPPEPANSEAEAAAPSGTFHMWSRVSCESPDLVLMRMEALQLDPAQVKAAMPAEFRVLAHVCNYCQDKVRCERDLVYEAAGKPVNWEHYCPNASRLRVMAPLQTDISV